MSYSIIKKYNWTFFAENILKALTGQKRTFMERVATGDTTTFNVNFRTVSIMNTDDTNDITVINSALQNVRIRPLTTINFDALNGYIKAGDLTVIAGLGKALVIGTY